MKILIQKFPIGLRIAIRNCLREVNITYKHFRGLWKAREIINQKNLKLNIGCGQNIKKGWVNIDLSNHADINLDMREPLPFHDNTCSFIYSEHFLEHLDYPKQSLSFLNECYRVLSNDGIFSCGVPDTEWPLHEYCGLVNKGYFHFAKEKWHPEWCQTKMEQINYHFRQNGEHKFAYDYRTLFKALQTVGFKEIKSRKFNSELDTEQRKTGSLYVEAKK